MARINLIRFLYVVFIAQPSLAFYFPGVAPIDFSKGENVEVKVNSIHRNKRLIDVYLKFLFFL